MAPAVARVLPEVAAVDRAFDYLAIDDPVPVVGDRVRVDLHGRSVKGWVVGVGDETTHGELKSIKRRLGAGPPSSVVDLCKWAAWRWAGPWSKMLTSASPSRIVSQVPTQPPPRALPAVHNQMRVFGQRLVRRETPTLVQVGPCTDPLDLVLSVLHGCEGLGRTGTVVVTTPTSGWAERLAERLRRRDISVAGPEQWAEAASGPRVVVGARAAALAPVPKVAAGISLDAHDAAYRQTQTPCWDGVSILVERCAREGAPFIATSWCATPTLLGNVGATEVLEHESRMWPRVVVADLSIADPRQRQLSATFVDAAHRALLEPGDGVRVAVILQRLGGARLLACRACGGLAVCEPHAFALRDVSDGLGCALGCHGLPKLCTICGSTKLAVLREGISTLAGRVASLLGVDVTEVSAGTAEIAQGARVVVGTEAVLTRVRHAGMVCFAELDDYLCAPRSHGSLEALRAIGLAGRLVGARGSATPGVVVLQTRLPTHAAVIASVNGAPGAVVAHEADQAAVLGLSPHVASCAMSGNGAHEFAAALARRGLEVIDEGERVIVSGPDHVVLCDALATTPRPVGALRVEVDPNDV